MDATRRSVLFLLFAFQLSFSIIQDRFNVVNGLIFGATTATVLALSTIFSELRIVIPVYSRLRRVTESQSWSLNLRVIYGIVGFLSFFVGTQIYSLVGLSIVAVSRLPRILELVSEGGTFGRIVEEGLWVKHLVDFIPVVALASVCAGLSFIVLSLTREVGPRSQVYAAYKHHRIRLDLEKEERRFQLVCVGLGTGISLYLAIMYLAVAFLKGSTSIDFTDWIKERVTPIRSNHDYFDETVFLTYQLMLGPAVLFMPFLDSKATLQIVFVILLCIPIAFSMIMTTYFERWLRANAISAAVLLRVVLSSGFFAAAMLQYVWPEANPLTAKIIGSLGVFKSSVDSQIIGMMCRTVFTAGLLYYAIEVLRDRSFQCRANNDPIGCVVDRKKGYLTLSVLMRVAFCLMFIDSSHLLTERMQDFKYVFYAFGLLMVVLLDSDGQGKFMEELASSFKRKRFKELTESQQMRLVSTIEKRNLFNVVFLAVALVLGLGTGNVFGRLVILASAIAVLMFYSVMQTSEAILLRKHLGIDLELEVRAPLILRIVSLGLLGMKTQKREH